MTFTNNEWNDKDHQRQQRDQRKGLISFAVGNANGTDGKQWMIHGAHGKQWMIHGTDGK